MVCYALIIYLCYYISISHLCLFKIKLSSSAITVATYQVLISSHMWLVPTYHTGEHKYTTFPSSQKVHLGSAGLDLFYQSFILQGKFQWDKKKVFNLS